MKKTAYFYYNDLKERKETVQKINQELEKMNNVDLDYVLSQLYIMNNCLDKIAFPEYHKVKQEA